MENTYAIILAGGNGSRMNAGINKILLPIKNRSCICRSVEAFQNWAQKIIVVCRPEDEHQIKAELNRLTRADLIQYTNGGNTRQDSVRKGLDALKEDSGIVLIHDAARCLVSEELISDIIKSVREYGSGVPSLLISDTIKTSDKNNNIINTIDRERLRSVQTPQGFLLEDLLKANKIAARDQYYGTDDASLMEHAGFKVHLVTGEKNNIKLTTKEDLLMAEYILGQRKKISYRVGTGYDVHRLVEGRKLIICGIEIPHNTGLLGHSDADVAVHALMDALLGAAGLGDIGQHFPDHDPQYEGISSIKLLKEVIQILHDKSYIPVNADITIVAQKPKLANYIPDMKLKIADAMNISSDCVNIKATTTEGLGFEGNLEGISSHAICLIQSLDSPD